MNYGLKNSGLVQDRIAKARKFAFDNRNANQSSDLIVKILGDGSQAVIESYSTYTDYPD
jgi:hypothetical protein